MAKEDFCFTYYDGDATRDMSHMTRLQRGAYSDIIIAIRKFGHLSLEQIKMTLSKDFEECWLPIKMIMKIDADDLFYLEWLETSIKNSRKSAAKQKEKIDKYWASKKENDNKIDSTDIPQYNHSIGSEEPLGDGDGNGIYVLKEINIAFDFFWNLYDKKVGDKEKLIKKWLKLSDTDRVKCIDYVPKYINAQPDKKFRKNPDTFLNNKSWNDEIITNGAYQRNTQQRTLSGKLEATGGGGY